jgi:hypothetical protein
MFFNLYHKVIVKYKYVTKSFSLEALEAAGFVIIMAQHIVEIDLFRSCKKILCISVLIDSIKILAGTI